MNLKIRNQWLQRLRDPETRQAFGVLRETYCAGSDAFCVLGLLCNIVDSDGWYREKQKSQYQQYLDDQEYQNPDYLETVEDLERFEELLAAEQFAVRAADQILTKDEWQSGGWRYNWTALPDQIGISEDDILILINLNDQAHLTFPELAEVVEEHWPELHTYSDLPDSFWSNSNFEI